LNRLHLFLLLDAFKIIYLDGVPLIGSAKDIGFMRSLDLIRDHHHHKIPVGHGNSRSLPQPFSWPTVDCLQKNIRVFSLRLDRCYEYTRSWQRTC